MPKYVQFHQYVMHRAKVVMCGNDRALKIICRMLYGNELTDFVFLWQNHHSGRMLTCRSFYTDTAGGQTVHFRIREYLFPVLTVALYITIGGLFCKRADGSRAETVSFSKQLLNVCVCFGLINAREIEINIRNLVSLEPQEYLKRDIKSLTDIFRPAFRAVRDGQVNPNLVFALVDIKVRMLAFRAPVMWRKRIDLGDADKMCHIGGADAAS